MDFLITSSVCLGASLAFYLFFLEREKMHRFNRFYLLGAIAFSLAIPIISFEVFVDTVIMGTHTPLMDNTGNMPVNSTNVEIGTDYIINAIWVLYYSIAIILLIRLIRNLLSFSTIIKNNTVKPCQNAKLVLVEDKVQPHTFGNHIFINKAEYENGKVDEQLLQHELAHARQKHSVDVIFIELLLAVFWFNPLLYFYKKAIRLNHEFLADEAVNSQNKNVPAYQELLLDRVASTKGLYPASSLTFSLTKKRFIMMTKHTSPFMSAVKKLLVLPVAASLISAFCIETTLVVKQQPNVSIVKPQEKKGSVTVDEYFAGVRFIAYEYGTQTKKEITGRNVLIDKVYEDLTEADKDYFSVFLYVPKPYVKKSPTTAEVKDFMNAKKYAIWIDGKNVPNTELGKYKRTDIAYFSGSVILKNARTKRHPQPFQYWFYTHKAFDAEKMGEQKRHYSGDKIEMMKRIEKK
jgi:beta-lactamase regulating signal transducer with metallopeptidase domain